MPDLAEKDKKEALQELKHIGFQEKKIKFKEINDDEILYLIKNLYENMKENIIDISDDQPKSFILTEKDKVVRGYVTNIGTNTIKKRKM